MAAQRPVGETLYGTGSLDDVLAPRPRHTYRVWMKDGYASLHTAENEGQAKAAAIKQAAKNCEGCAMTAADLRKGTTVDYAEKISR